ncbi:LysE family translocator [Terrarubrum flagellatum]|uniref:LysE family translocator n=1 Tax=Terrirubrum flagellatum TaxID=2895980 RepID=UPI003144EE0D
MPFFAPDFGAALLSLILSSLIVMGSPGPSTVSVTAVGAAFGFRRSLPYAAGLILGTTVVLAAVASGAVALLLSVPAAATALTILSAVYMLWLAFRIATAPPLGEPDAARQAPPLAAGLALAIANPKAWFAIAAVFAGVTLFRDGRFVDGALKFAVLTGMIVLIHLGWLIAGASLSQLLRDPVRSRIANVGFAILLVAATLHGLLR